MRLQMFLASMVLPVAAVQAALPTDLAAAFGARETVRQASLSPDGQRIALVTSGSGQSSRVDVIDVATGTSKSIRSASGNPEHLSRCFWIGARRLACTLYARARSLDYIVGRSVVVALDDDGSNLRSLSNRSNIRQMYVDGRGGDVIDLLPDQDGAVLMTRSYVPEVSTGNLTYTAKQGLGVDQVNSRTGAAKLVVPPKPWAVEYQTDGFGEVRILGVAEGDSSGYAKPTTRYMYRKQGQSDWQALSVYDGLARTGFNPYAVDRDKNVAFGLEKIDGRFALVSYALDGSLKRQVLVAHPSVDVDTVVQVGRRQRVIGAQWTTDRTEAQYFEPAYAKLQADLSKALGGKQVAIVDATTDEQILLISAGSDTDAGTYYLLNRKTGKLDTVIEQRPQLNDVKLAEVKPIRYRAADGTEIPAYLTLPVGSTGKNLPAIVMPHGGPSSRDYWGFDWLPQYFAAKGFAVIQPQYRGSAGYGDEWYQKNGFQSWRTAIGGVADAGRWLVKQGIADSARLSIFGWSYGGYAALQSTVAAPGLFKRAVAVAPVTDLATLTAPDRADYNIVRAFVGTGPHVREGSPAQNADKVSAPVLLFHGDMDSNVRIDQSQLMAARLRAAGKPVDLVTFDGLDHQLDDGDARATVLRRSAEFLAATK